MQRYLLETVLSLCRVASLRPNIPEMDVGQHDDRTLWYLLIAGCQDKRLPRIPGRAHARLGLPLEECRQEPSRPYEKATNERGDPGLSHVPISRVFRNMEVVTNVNWLSNAYYKRWKARPARPT